MEYRFLFSSLHFLLFFFFVFLGPQPWHMEVPRLGVESELQPAYTRATAMLDPSRVCNLHHSSRQCWIPNPPSEARDQTHILMDTRQACYCWTTTGTSWFVFLLRRKWYKKIQPIVGVWDLTHVRPYLQHTEVLRLGDELELQLPAYTTATAMGDLSHICDLHCSKARVWTHILKDTSWVLNPLSHNMNSCTF